MCFKFTSQNSAFGGYLGRAAGQRVVARENNEPTGLRKASSAPLRHSRGIDLLALVS
jgi:hypothetical protein